MNIPQQNILWLSELQNVVLTLSTLPSGVFSSNSSPTVILVVPKGPLLAITILFPSTLISIDSFKSLLTFACSSGTPAIFF